MNRGKTGGGIGTNQYQVRGRAKNQSNKVLSPNGITAVFVGNDVRRRCGEVWGTKCQVWVAPPGYTHSVHPSKGARERYAGRADADPRVLEWLSRDQAVEVRGGVAENPNTSPAVLDTLARDKDAWVRRMVAGNPNASPGLLDSLARDEDGGIRYRVAGNPNTSPGVLDRLSRDQAGGVRQRVAGNPNTGLDILKRLASDKDQQVVEAMLSNPNLPDTVRAIIILGR